MTKEEIFACTDVSEIWKAIKDSPTMRADPEIWRYMSKLSAIERLKRLKEFFKTDDIDLCQYHIDISEKSNRHKTGDNTDV